MHKTLKELDVTDYMFRPKRISAMEPDGVIFLVFKYPSQSIRVIETFEELYFGENAYNGKQLSCKPNGFTNNPVVNDYLTRNYKDQESGVKAFNARYYKRAIDGNYTYLPAATAHRVVSERSKYQSNDYNNNDVRNRLDFNSTLNSNSYNDYDDDSFGNGSQINHSNVGTSASFSIKTETSYKVDFSLKVENDGNQAKRRKTTASNLTASNSTSTLSKQQIKIENDDNYCVIIEKPVDLNKIEDDLEEIMGSQPFSCVRCGLSFRGSEVIKHRCQKVVNIVNEVCSDLYPQP